MRAAGQLPGKGPTDVDDAPAPHLHVNQKSDYDIYIYITWQGLKVNMLANRKFYS